MLTPRLIIPVIISIVALSLTLQPTTAQTSAETVQLIEASDSHVIVEITLPELESSFEAHEGIRYQRLFIPGWEFGGEVGMPRLPMQAVTLGLSALEQPQVEIIDYDTETRSLEAPLLPQPSWQIGADGLLQPRYQPDNIVYQADQFWPMSLAEVGEVGILRDQPVFQLRLYPVQINPQQQTLRLYNRLRVRVSWPTDERSKSSRQADRLPTSKPFEGLLKSQLLNYDSLPRPSVGPRQTAPLPRQTSSSPQLNLLVEEAALYRLTYADLAAISPQMVAQNPAHLALSYRGNPAPMHFVGDDDAMFETGEYFIFYGEALRSQYTRYNVYQLSINPSGGLRMVKLPATPNGSVAVTDFQASLFVEKNDQYWRDMPNSEGKEHWFWRNLENSGSPSATTFEFDLANLPTSGPDGQLRLRVYGSSFSDYQVNISLNGNALTSETWNGRIEHTIVVDLPHSYLRAGNNQLRLENTQADSEFYIDWFELVYQKAYIATDNQLEFASANPVTHSYTIHGLTATDLHLFDLTAGPIYLTDTTFVNGTLQFNFDHPNSTVWRQRFMVQSAATMLRPQIVVDEPSSWRQPSHEASYLIITHPDFHEAIQPLADYRTAQGETVITAKTVDVYNEFNHGVVSPQAIKDFIGYTLENWAKPPTYVLLVGDASNDPKNYRGNSQRDYLPTYLVNSPSFGHAPSEQWYSLVKGEDSLPDVIMGRLPVQTTVEVATYINKVKAYEANRSGGNWIRTALLVGHDEQPTFKEDMETVAALLPDSISPLKLYERTYNGQLIGKELPKLIEQGSLLIAYSGHGSERVWAKGYSILRATQIDQLNNGTRLPFVTAANCLTNFFVGYGYDDTIGSVTQQSPPSMAELLLFRQNGGAIAIWAPGSFGFPTPNGVINAAFYKALVVDEAFRPGVAATSAQLQALKADSNLKAFFETFLYLGDPALKLDVPVGLALSGRSSATQVTLGDSVSYNLTYTVSGGGTANQLTLISSLPNGLTYQSAQPPPTRRYGNKLTWELGNVSATHQSVTIQTTVNGNGLNHQQAISQTAQLYDHNGGQQVITLPLTVLERPINGLTASQDGPKQVGQAVQLSAAVAEGSNVQFEWQIDSRSYSQAIAHHIFTQAGPYSATLTARNAVSSQTAQVDIQVVEPPQAAFVISGTQTTNQSLTFVNQSQAGYPEAIYQWDFGDGQSSTAIQPTHRYTIPGTYVATLQVSNPLLTATTRQTLTIGLGDAPLEGLAVRHDGPTVLGNESHFTATLSSGNRGNYRWDFGDGSAAVEQCCLGMVGQVSHRYTATGLYTVQVVVTNSWGMLSQQSLISVTDRLPQAKFITSSPDSLGNATRFSTQATGSNLHHVWDFGDGSPVGQGRVVTHSYLMEGLYTAVLTVSNGSGFDVATQTVQVVRDVGPPLARFSSNSPTQMGQVVQFINLSQDGGDNPQAVSYQWNFGNGMSIQTTRLTDIVSQTYSVGQYLVMLTVTNSLSQAIYSETVTVIDEAIIGLDFSHDGPTQLGQTTRFSPTLTSGTNVTYTWNLGDGHVVVGERISHQYAQTGRYTVTLTVNNSRNHLTMTRFITVTDLPLIGLTLTRSQSLLQVGQPLWLTASLVQGSQVTYLWNFGDNQTLVTNQPIISYTYQTEGSYTPTVIAQNSVSLAKAVTTVSVLSCQPIERLRLILSNPMTVSQPLTVQAIIKAGSEINYRWNFGDGSPTQNGATVTYKYAKSGTYPLSLTAENCWGTLHQTVELRVQDVPISGLRAEANQPTFLGASTTISVSLTAGTGVTLSFSPGDGSAPQTTTAPSETGRQLGPPLIFRHTYPKIGRYEAEIMAQNGRNTVRQSLTITVRLPAQPVYLPIITVSK